MPPEENQSSIALILLAAGSSIRMGDAGAKQFLTYRGKTLLRRAAETAAGSVCCPLVCVTGFESDRASGEIAGLPFKIVRNDGWEKGMGTSIRCGIDALASSNEVIGGALIMLCDQPLVTSDLLNTLVETSRSQGSSIVASFYNETAGVPALFLREHFEELLSLPPEIGARKVIQRHNSALALVPFAGGAIDIDTVEEYGRLTII